jgi:peptide/nickel transport system ATP-binding protein
LSGGLLHVDLTAGYGRDAVIETVRFDLGRGERLGLVGSSGAGKSTLVFALLGLLPWRRGWAKGEVVLGGKNLLALNEREARKLRGKIVALVPQSPMTALNSALSLRAHFEEAWRAHEDGGRDRLARRMGELLERVHLPGDSRFLARRPQEISVGQGQRALIALALLHRPALLIADEPTSALDPVTQTEILHLLRQSSVEDGTALLYISHDLLSVLQLCDRIAVLHQGSIVESLAVERIEQEARHPSTLALLGTLPAPPDVLLSYSRGEAKK